MHLRHEKRGGNALGRMREAEKKRGGAAQVKGHDKADMTTRNRICYTEQQEKNSLFCVCEYRSV